MSETSGLVTYGGHWRGTLRLTAAEAASLQRTGDRLDRLREFLGAHPSPALEAPPQVWFAYLSEVKAILGNFSNDLSFVSCLLAKAYLTSRLTMAPFDVAEKPQGAIGLDIDAHTTSGERVIGEIKTTTPYKGHQFGAAQVTALRKDFAKLQAKQAEHKYMFVTNQAAFEALSRSFTDELVGVTIVCLTSAEECSCLS